MGFGVKWAKSIEWEGREENSLNARMARLGFSFLTLYFVHVRDIDMNVHAPGNQGHPGSGAGDGPHTVCWYTQEELAGKV